MFAIDKERSRNYIQYSSLSRCDMLGQKRISV